MRVKPSSKSALDKAIRLLRNEGYELFIVAFQVAERGCICSSPNFHRQDCDAHEPKVEVLCSAVREREQMQIMAREVLELAATPPAIQIVN